MSNNCIVIFFAVRNLAYFVNVVKLNIYFREITVASHLLGEADPHAVDVNERSEYGGGARAAPGGPGQPGPGAAPAAEGLGPALHVQPEDGTECGTAPALPAGTAARYELGARIFKRVWGPGIDSKE